MGGLDDGNQHGRKAQAAAWGMDSGEVGDLWQMARGLDNGGAGDTGDLWRGARAGEVRWASLGQQEEIEVTVVLRWMTTREEGRRADLLWMTTREQARWAEVLRRMTRR